MIVGSNDEQQHGGWKEIRQKEIARCKKFDWLLDNSIGHIKWGIVLFQQKTFPRSILLSLTRVKSFLDQNPKG
jgi:hypothetical protein